MLAVPLYRELLDRIDVFETKGTDKNRTYKIVIYCSFMGYIAIPECYFSEDYIFDIQYRVEIDIKTNEQKSCSVYK